MANRTWLAILTLIAAIAPALPAETHCPGNVASVPLRHANAYQMIVAVSLNHSGPYDFLLDTGTQMTIIDPAIASDLHLCSAGRAAIVGVGFHESVGMADLDTLAVGDHSISDQRILVSDLSTLKPVNLSIQGILGEDFLQNFDMLIDNSHGVLCLDDTNAMRADLKGSHLPLLPQEPTQGAPAARSLVLNVHFRRGMRLVRMKLDSGANAPFLYRPNECLDIGIVEGASWHGSGANGKQQAFVPLPSQEMKIGDVELPKVPFLALRDEGKSAHTSAFDGLMPTGLFRRVFVSRGGEFAILDPAH